MRRGVKETPPRLSSPRVRTALSYSTYPHTPHPLGAPGLPPQPNAHSHNVTPSHTTHPPTPHKLPASTTPKLTSAFKTASRPNSPRTSTPTPTSNPTTPKWPPREGNSASYPAGARYSDTWTLRRGKINGPFHDELGLSEEVRCPLVLTHD